MKKIKSKWSKTSKVKKVSKDNVKHMAHFLSDGGSSLASDESSPAIERADSMTHFGDPPGIASKREQTISFGESLATNKEKRDRGQATNSYPYNCFRPLRSMIWRY